MIHSEYRVKNMHLFIFMKKKVDLRPPGSDNFKRIRPRCWHLWAIEFFFFMNVEPDPRTSLIQGSPLQNQVATCIKIQKN